MFSTPGSPAQVAREVGIAFDGSVTVAQLTCSSSGAATSATSADGHAEADELSRVQQLYEEHSSSLVRRLTRKTGCRELAREIASETFVRILRMSRGDLGRIEKPEAFLGHVATNLLRDEGRASVLRERSRTALELDANLQVDQVAVLESRDTLRRLEQALARLKPKTRKIFLEHRIHGFSYGEIAERNGLTVKGVEKQMSKAIAKIDRLLDRG